MVTYTFIPYFLDWLCLGYLCIVTPLHRTKWCNIELDLPFSIFKVVLCHLWTWFLLWTYSLRFTSVTYHASLNEFGFMATLQMQLHANLPLLFRFTVKIAIEEAAHNGWHSLRCYKQLPVYLVLKPKFSVLHYYILAGMVLCSCRPK